MGSQDKPKRTALERRQRSNRITGYIVPCILFALVGYATYVMVVPLCAHYYFHPSSASKYKSKLGVGVAFLVIYFVLFTLMAAAYARMLYTVSADAGYIPKGAPSPSGTVKRWIDDPAPDITCPCTEGIDKTQPEPEPFDALIAESKPGRKARRRKGDWITALDYDAILAGRTAAPPGLEEFYSRDVFQCDPRGLPIWCGHCNAWKPDRAHHCSDIGRCVRNMDHFCPWVGGVVGETNLKFFVQFNMFASLYTAFNIIAAAYSLSNAASYGPLLRPNVHWLVLIGLSSLFWLFTSGMVMVCLQHAWVAQTTVDALDARNRVIFLAIRTDGHIPPVPHIAVNKESDESMKRNPMAIVDEPNPPVVQGSTTYPLTGTGLSFSRLSATLGPRHTFLIVQSPRGMNPWDLGPLQNMREIMGDKWYDWLLPLKRSPWCRQDQHASMYPLGKQFVDLRRKIGLVDA